MVQKSTGRRTGIATFLEKHVVFAPAGSRLLHFWNVRAVRAKSRTSQVVSSHAVAKAACGVSNEAVCKSAASKSGKVQTGHAQNFRPHDLAVRRLAPSRSRLGNATCNSLPAACCPLP